MNAGTYYKVLAEDGSAYHGGSGQWALPRNGRPGDWMPKLPGKIVPCAHGYHLCRPGDLVQWLGPTIWTAELDADATVIELDDKVVTAGRVRLVQRCEHWTERTARLFACWCAEQALPIWERNHPDDRRPHETIAVARRFAGGAATTHELAAAHAAAYAAYAAHHAAHAAAYHAAYAAAYAAGHAACAAAREAQTTTLLRLLTEGVEP